MIRYTMRTSNIKDYPLDRLQLLIDYFSPNKVLALSRDRNCLVAEINDKIIGTVALEGKELCTFFVHPDYQNTGIGTHLLEKIESVAETKGISKIKAEASISGVAFYEKNGYRKTGMDKDGTAGKQIIMEKNLNKR